MADHPSPDAITEWLVQYRGGQREALDRLVPVLYDELRAMAARAWLHAQLKGEGR